MTSGLVIGAVLDSAAELVSIVVDESGTMGVVTVEVSDILVVAGAAMDSETVL
jgi:hypothetical protein